MQSLERRIVILGSGGTIAGVAASGGDNLGYRAGQISVTELVAAVPMLGARPLEAEQVAQLDSKDMDAATWQRLASCAAHHLGRDDVAAVVITHGTDTLEETAWFLHRVLAPGKPLVLTAAMRPATSLLADGPQNLLDAVTVASLPQARGVLVVFAGRVHEAAAVQKIHSHRLDAFDSPDVGPIALIEEGKVRKLREWPQGQGLGLESIASDPLTWPWVEIVCSHADAGARGVDAWVAAGVQGLVVTGTGNGTVHQALNSALQRAAQRGLAVRVATRCLAGGVLPHAGQPWLGYPGLNAAKSRIELVLEMLVKP